MGLEKTLETPFGVNATYWKLVSYQIDELAKKATCILVGYKDKQAKNANKKPMCHRQFVISGTEFDSLNEQTPTKRQLYNLIKAQVEFADAQDE